MSGYKILKNIKLMVHTVVGASFRMETAAASARLGSYLFAGFQHVLDVNPSSVK